LSEAHLEPEWIAGISVGAINAALIAGNPPRSRVEKLREFWRRVTCGGPTGMSPVASGACRGRGGRPVSASALLSILGGKGSIYRRLIAPLVGSSYRASTDRNSCVEGART